jgi:hypothetical protein
MFRTLQSPRLAVLLACASAAAACNGRAAEPAGTPSPAETDETAATATENATEAATGEAEPAAPPRPGLAAGSLMIGGSFEHVTSVGGVDVSHGLSFDGAAVTRSLRGALAGREPYRVVDDATGRVVIELGDAGGTVVRREFVFIDHDTMLDSAAPLTRYSRTEELEDVLEARVAAASEGSGVSP